MDHYVTGRGAGGMAKDIRATVPRPEGESSREAVVCNNNAWTETAKTVGGSVHDPRTVGSRINHKPPCKARQGNNHLSC